MYIEYTIKNIWKGIETLRVKHPTPSRAMDALIGEEEQKGKQKITKGNNEIENERLEKASRKL